MRPPPRIPAGQAEFLEALTAEMYWNQPGRGCSNWNSFLLAQFGSIRHLAVVLSSNR
jgi:hypothetical protein